jgi:hypothetical protein
MTLFPNPDNREERGGSRKKKRFVFFAASWLE